MKEAPCYFYNRKWEKLRVNDIIDYEGNSVSIL